MTKYSMVKLNGVISNKHSKPGRIVSPLIADTVRQIEDIVLSSLRASSQIDFIFCVNNSILKFYFPLAGGELLEQVGKLCLAEIQDVGFCWGWSITACADCQSCSGQPAWISRNISRCKTFRLDWLNINPQGRPWSLCLIGVLTPTPLCKAETKQLKGLGIIFIKMTDRPCHWCRVP